jgi:radical SAM superfamily enzyme YgiQ (UPF0313 family)/tetratricopeptide (TPR) repeat protein
MTRQVRGARFVLVVCSPTYLRRFKREEKRGVGLGAAWESMLTQNQLYASGAINDRFIPVAFQSGGLDNVPDELQGTTRFCLEEEAGYEQLFRRILEIPPAQKPPLGKVKQERRLKSLPVLPSRPEFFTYKRDRVVHYPWAPLSKRSASVLRPGSFCSNLPEEPAIVGRTKEAASVSDALRSGAKLVYVCGHVGTGKTTLVLSVAHQLARTKAFSVIVWAPVRHGGMTLDGLCDEIAQTLNAQYVKRLTLEDKTAEVGRLLAKNLSLVLLPDFDCISDSTIEPYLRSLPNTVQVVLSGKGPGAAGSFVLNLPRLAEEDARTVVRNETARLGMSASRTMTDSVMRDVCKACGNIPLAIQLAVSLIDHQFRQVPKLPEIRQKSPVNTILGRLWPTLSDEERRILCALSHLPDPATPEAAQAIAGIASEGFRTAVEHLLRMRLIVPGAGRVAPARRLGIHRAVVEFVAAKRDETLSQADAHARIADHYLAFVTEKGGLERSSFLDDMEAERLNIARAMRACQCLGRSREFVRFHRCCYHMFWARGYWNQNLDNGRTAIALAGDLDQLEDAAWIHMECVGWTHFCRGDYTLARTEYARAKAIIDGLPNPTPGIRARLYNYLGRLSAAEENYTHAVSLLWEGLRHTEDDLTATFLESALGDVYSAMGNTGAAIAHYQTVRALRERMRDDFRLCSVLCDIAELMVESGDVSGAGEIFEHGLRIAGAVKHLEVTARCLLGIGEVNLACGDREGARRHLRGASEAFEQLGRDRELERIKGLLPLLDGDATYTPGVGAVEPAAPPSKVEVLLINAPRDAASTGAGSQDRRMPLGLCSIAAFLEHRGVSTRIVDAEASSLGVAGIVDVAKDLNPRVIGLNCHTLNRRVVYEIARTLKGSLRKVLMVLGGAHAALAPELTLDECPAVDVVVTGEGERSMYELCRRQDDRDAVPGIFYRSQAGVHRNPPMPRIENLDIIGLPDLGQLPMNVYLNYEEPALPGLWNRAYLNASRGCRSRCSYCTEHVFWLGGPTFRSAASIAAEISEYKRIYGTHRFYFYDDTLTDWPGLDDFCELAGGLGVQWSCSTRIDAMTPVLAQRLARGGCKEIAFGLESGSKKSLAKMNKGLRITNGTEKGTPPDLLAAIGERIRICSENRIVPRAHFMIGFHWEDRADISETVKLAVRLKAYSLTDANFFVVKIYPQTPLHSAIHSLQASKGLSDRQIYDAWSVHDWESVSNPKVAAKLRRFNDIPRISMHPCLDNLSLRRVVRNAYEIFFSDVSDVDVDKHLWSGVA